MSTNLRSRVPWEQLFKHIYSAQQALRLSNYWNAKPDTALAFVALGENHDVVIELEIENNEVNYFVFARDLGKKFYTNCPRSAVLEAFVWIAEIELTSVLRGV